MRAVQIILILGVVLLGSGAYAHGGQLEDKLVTLERLSSSIARDVRRSGLYGNLYYEAERLSREARRLSRVVERGGQRSNIRAQYRDLDKQFQRFERKYRSINSRHRRGHIHRDYLSIVGLFGDIRLIYRRGDTKDYRAYRGYGNERYYDRGNRHRNGNRHDHRDNRKRQQGFIFSREHQRKYSGGRRFDRDDKRRNHYRQ